MGFATQASALEFDAMSVMDDAIENGVTRSGIAE
jgi:hypothetical protein